MGKERDSVDMKYYSSYGNWKFTKARIFPMISSVDIVADESPHDPLARAYQFSWCGKAWNIMLPVNRKNYKRAMFFDLDAAKEYLRKCLQL
jgi:hypothetical protein